jgi:hypothetical protein
MLWGLEALPYEPRGGGVWFCSLPSWAFHIREKKAHILGCRKAKKETPAKVIDPVREDGF